MAFDERLGPDRFGGLDVVLDDGAQHGEPTFLAHDLTSFAWVPLSSTPGWHSRCQSASTRQVYVVDADLPGASHTGAGMRVPTLPAWTGTERMC